PGYSWNNPACHGLLSSMHHARPLLAVLLLLASSSLVWGLTAAASPTLVQPLSVGVAMPAATLRTADDQAVQLADLVEGRSTVLIFYRGGWCPYCTRQLADLQEVEAGLTDLGYQLIALSPDRPFAVAEAMNKHHYAYRLFSDRGMEAAAAFGLAFRMDDETRQAYEGYGFDLAPIPGEPEARWLPVPAVFLVDRSGTIRFAHSDANYPQRLTPEELLVAARRALNP
ncbi:MAG: peroxiredoxin-like family protein, partial [Candidatus Didemnitutus sp.]|nr:peroxiredoxin-like family protein [Candidatus Didemnitutus sp.]